MLGNVAFTVIPRGSQSLIFTKISLRNCNHAVCNQGRSQTQNLGGTNIFWKNKISEVDFIHFYEN